MLPLGMQTSDVRSSAWFGAICRLGYLIINFHRSGAGPGAMSEAQRRTVGGNGFLFMFPPNIKGEVAGTHSKTRQSYSRSLRPAG